MREHIWPLVEILIASWLVSMLVISPPDPITVFLNTGAIFLVGLFAYWLGWRRESLLSRRGDETPVDQEEES